MYRPNFRELPLEEMTAEERARCDNEDFFWDAYKEVYGHRPRWLPIRELTDENLNDRIVALVAELDFNHRMWLKRQAELIEARSNPKAIIFLSDEGEMMQQYELEYELGGVDPINPDYWEWYIQEAPKPVPIWDPWNEVNVQIVNKNRAP